MAPSDIPGGLRLNTLAGWNQTEADWQRFLRGSPNGCFVAEDGARVVGTAATLAYEDRFAWIGMVLVDPEYRGRGIGTKLLQRAIEYLDQAGIPTLKLDATPLGKPLYEKLGFVSEYEIERWILQRTTGKSVPNAASDPVKLSEIVACDRGVFGADRGGLLRTLDEQAPELTLAAGRGREGYAFGRHGLFADHLGPWMAHDSKTARSLLDDFLARSPRSTVVVDSPKSNTAAARTLREAGFSVSRPLTRMHRGPNAFPGRPEMLCAILGPEFG